MVTITDALNMLILWIMFPKSSFLAFFAACYRNDVWPENQDTPAVFREKSVAWFHKSAVFVCG
jgi:hypothetical protein